MTDEIAALLRPLLTLLEGVIWVQRRLHPPLAGRLADALAPAGEAVRPPLAGLEAVAGPLSGMSDGATYGARCFLAAGNSPFTHFAPACGMLLPFLLGGGAARARGRPIYLVHGGLDWMFPVDTARAAHEALQAAGARIVYRELDDLSHTYPRDENPAILDWLMA